MTLPIKAQTAYGEILHDPSLAIVTSEWKILQQDAKELQVNNAQIKLITYEMQSCQVLSSQTLT
jgi:hypothetical protein